MVKVTFLMSTIDEIIPVSIALSNQTENVVLEKVLSVSEGKLPKKKCKISHKSTKKGKNNNKNNYGPTRMRLPTGHAHPKNEIILKLHCETVPKHETREIECRRCGDCFFRKERYDEHFKEHLKVS